MKMNKINIITASLLQIFIYEKKKISIVLLFIKVADNFFVINIDLNQGSK